MGHDETQALMDAAVDAITVIDASGRIVRCNRAAARLFGYAEHELAGLNVSELMPEPYRASHDQYLARYAQTGVPHIIGIGREVEGQRKDGSVFPLFLSVGHIAGSEPARYVGILHDLTARRQAQAALRTERDRAQAYLELNDAILVALDEQGRIRTANPRACALFGAPEHELLGREWLEFVDDDDRSRAEQLLASLTAGPAGQVHAAELSARTVKGGSLWLEWRCIAWRGADETLGGILCAGRDLSERRAREDRSHVAQQQLMRVARLATMGEMASSIAHELNQPLAAISNYARACERYLQMSQPDVEEMREALREIAAEALRAGDMIRRMRRMAQDERSQRVLTDVNELVNELAMLMQADARMHDAKLRFEPAQDLPRVSLDAVQIQQVVLNLVRNALEAVADVPADSRLVTVSTARADDGGIEITVTDNGPGIAPAIRDRLFEPFATTKGSGHGLGLSMSRSIVQAHGGTITCRPHNPHGTAFVVRIPLPAALSSSA